jgi:hypothetical protein
MSRVPSPSLQAAFAGLCLLLASPPAPVAGQATAAGGRYEVFVNSELENYLRWLQIGGEAALYPWSIRSFSPAEIDRLAPEGVHPWLGRFDLAADTGRSFRWGWVRPSTQVIYNSAFPYGANQGAVWAGRGLTTALQAGVAAQFGPLSITLAPIAFRAENDAFELQPNGMNGRLSFASGRQFSDGRGPLRIDLPQRFGDQPYARIDPGQSTIRLDLPVITAGVSTANQHWGPAEEHPLVLGNNAPGYVHGFLGTSTPVNLWIGHLHSRLVWGRLEQSEYSPVGRGRIPRFSSGAVIAFTPRGFPGLELGAARFFHEAWPIEGLDAAHFFKPLGSLLKVRLADRAESGDGSDEDNQLASLFFRLALPRSGLEAYAEYARYDHSWDLRDLILEPDHDSGYMLGARKRWQLSTGRFVALRGEVLNTAIGHLHQVRTPQVPFYVHDRLRQGHTHRGQALGSAAAYGGGGSLLAADYYHPGGRLTLSWNRELRQERGNYWWDHSPDALAPDALDVIHALGIEVLTFHRGWEVLAGLTGAYNLNRNYQSDVFNFAAGLQFRAGF